MLSLSQEFEAALIEGYHRAGREVGYWGHRFLQAVRRAGGVPTARRMLAAGKQTSQGFDALLRAGRPDLTVEAIVLRPRFRSLFTLVERKAAQQRLIQKRQTAAEIRERLYPDELEPGVTYPEGASQRVTVNAYERSAKARAACIKVHGTACLVCTVQLEGRYGEIGHGFIHVHHLRSVAATGRRRVDPARDLIPVCPNCHAMLHRREPPFTPDELRAKMSTRAG